MNTKSFTTLEFNKIIDKLAALACSDGAKSILKKLEPMTNEADINARLDETNDALSRIYQKGSVDFSQIRDIRASVARLKVGSSLNAHELLDISSLLSCTSHVKGYYEARTDSITAMLEALEPVSVLNSLIKKCIISEDEISDDASPNLRSIRRSKSIAADKIHTELNKLVNSTVYRTYLQDYVITTRQGRYCLPVKSEYKSQVPGMVHDQSQTGSTLFIEPAAVVKLNNDIRELELKEASEIEVIFADLSSKASEYTEALISDYEILTSLDCIFAKALLSRQYHCNRPRINTNGFINIKQGRHPLIDANVVVPIDIYLGKDFNLLIITGPNTGGKTVSLKTVGLLTLMAQAGLNIPALENSDIAIFNEVFADIGDEQSIEQSLSTFSSHMTNTVRILQQATPESLILFDEIGAGTDPTEGAALAISILNELKMRGCTTMATTHYSEIKLYALSADGVENASCEFDVESLRPTYRLLIGIPGKSNAFAISKKLGLPEYILNDAAKRLNSEDIHFEDLVSDLEQARLNLEREQNEVEAYKKEVEALKKKLELKNERIDERTDNIIRKANEEAAVILKEAKEYADETIKTMNRHGMSVKELEKRRSDIREKINKKQENLSLKPAAVTSHKAHDISEFKEGMYVKVLSMNVTGTVSAIHPARNQVTVLVGSLSAKMPVSNLAILSGYTGHDEDSSKAGGSSKTGGGSGKIKMSKSVHVSPEINLLGYTVDEAVAKLDKYLDDAYIAKLPQVRIVHGKGTGALRSGITAYLKGVPYIKEFRLGQLGEGDAGVTVVDFK